ncbi:MAG: glycosyltransferase [Myxococcota bacterium]
MIAVRRPIRILFTISDLRGGGAEREFSILVRHLSRARFEPHLCFWRPVFAYQPPEGVPVHMIEKSRPWHVFRAIAALRRLIDELRPDLVFSQLHYVNMVTGSALAKTRHRPRWVCRQVNDPRREMRGAFAVWARRSLRRADRALGCCDGVSRAMRQHLRLEAGRVSTMVNAVDVDRIARLAAEPLPIERSPGVFTVVHAGRLEPQKNQAMLLEAFRRLRDRPAELWILGEGPLRGRLEARSRALGLGARVRWLGFRENPYPFFRAADCFALSSDHEGLPNALIEAMLCGVPAVATRCPYGPDELIEDGVSGSLVPVGQAAAFGEALVRLADDRAARRRMGAEAQRRTAARFDTRVVCGAYEDLFESLVSADGADASSGARSA